MADTATSATDTDTVRTDDTAHTSEGLPIVGDLDSFPSHAELARTVLHGGAVASLATLTIDGHPYSSTVAFSTDDTGAPILCVSEFAEHARNLGRDPRASLLAHQRVDSAVDPLTLARATVIGRFTPVEPDDEMVGRHVESHHHTSAIVGRDDVAWLRMDVSHVRYFGGFGVIGWASADDVAAARPDPVIPVSGPMIEHLNDDHADACLEIARHLAGLDDAECALVTSLDRHGMTLSVRRSDGPDTVARVRFTDSPLDDPDAVRAATVELARRARAHGSATPPPPAPPPAPTPPRTDLPPGRTT
ncbi:MAG: DUF2470 domain-containing protein [Actinomycetota bacterium]